MALDPAGADRDELLAALVALRALREDIANWEPELITAARAAGASWAALAPALGLASRQAAERRYLRLQRPADGAATGEGRVRAERDKRAGDRAVSAWARANAATLRQLAGQVSALDGLEDAGQERAERVQEALAGSDPAALLSPLAEARPHLREGHAGHAALAARISAVTEQARRLHQDTVAGRAGGQEGSDQGPH
nr:HSP18 transcriptional regulator [Amycolatopsis aidingensis]